MALRAVRGIVQTRTVRVREPSSATAANAATNAAIRVRGIHGQL